MAEQRQTRWDTDDRKKEAAINAKQIPKKK